jgi:hypothetical protein
MRRVAKVVIACFLGATVVSPVSVLADEEVVQTPTEARESDLKSVAAARGWTVAEARAQIEASEEARRIGQEIRQRRPDIYIGAALSDKPGGPPSLYVKGPAPEFVEDLVAKAASPMKLVDGQPYSRDELQARAERVFDSLLEAGYKQVTTDVDITGAGTIPVAVLETAGLSSKTSEVLARVPSGLRSSVELTVSQKPFGDGDHARGGPEIYPHAYPGSFCTAGFSVEHQTNGKKGVVSAGHCGKKVGEVVHSVDRMHNSNPHTLWIQDEYRGYWGDVEWYTTDATEEPTFRATSSLVRDVLYRRKAEDIQVNDPQCLWGMGGGGHHDCSADVLYVSRQCCCTASGGNYQRMVVMDKDVGLGGDSGGPWYWNNTAVGIHHGDCSLVPNKDAFTPIDFLDEAMSVTVMKAE